MDKKSVLKYTTNFCALLMFISTMYTGISQLVKDVAAKEENSEVVYDGVAKIDFSDEENISSEETFIHVDYDSATWESEEGSVGSDEYIIFSHKTSKSPFKVSFYKSSIGENDIKDNLIKMGYSNIQFNEDSVFGNIPASFAEIMIKDESGNSKISDYYIMKNNDYTVLAEVDMYMDEDNSVYEDLAKLMLNTKM